MQRFLRTLAGFAAIQLVVFVALVAKRPDMSRSYVAASADKHQRAATVIGPRMLFVGGSNVAFGIDSPAVHKALGYHPINLGLAVHMGFDYMLNEARDLARPGDIVVLSPEFEHFVIDTTHFASLNILTTEPKAVRYYSWAQRKKLLDSGFLFLNKLVRSARKKERHRDDTARIHRDGFNEYGDVVAHHGARSTYAGVFPGARFTIDRDYMDQTIDKINAFVDECQARNIRVYFLHPSVADDQSAVLRSGEIDVLESALAADLKAPRLDTLAEGTFPRELFYDTCYHLGLEGKQRRTRLLISRLREQLVPHPTADLHRVAAR